MNINDEDLFDFYPYKDYVKTYLYHLAYEKQILANNKGNIDVYFMQIALENIKTAAVKNDFLRQGMWYVLLNEYVSNEEKAKAKRLFFDHCSNEKSVAEIANLIKASERLPKGQKLPNVEVFDTQNVHFNLNTIVKGKNIVLYTWPTDLRQIDNLAKRVNYLEKKYPKYRFIGLNLKNSEYQWKKQIKLKKLNPKNQYRIDNRVAWLNVNFSRAILINKKGIVQNNMTHLLNRHFEKQLKNLKEDSLLKN